MRSLMGMGKGIRAALSLAFASAVFCAGCSPDPNSVADQSEILMKAKGDKARLGAVQRLSAIGTDEAVSAMTAALTSAPPPSGKVTAALAKALGEKKAQRAVGALTQAIDFAAGTGSDQTTVDANAANKEIARALIDIGDPAAAEAMARLLRASQDNYVRIEAINALAKFKVSSTAEVLIDVVNDERNEPFIAKKALIALGEMKSEAALETFLWMLFYERKGTSFFPEAAMGVSALGSRAVDALISVLEGKDKELLARVKEEKLNPAAMMAKSAQVLGDLGNPKAVPALVKLLKYANESDPRSQFFVRMAAADALGRIRAPEAVKPLQSMLGEEEVTARQTYIRALFMIGDASTAKKLQTCAAKDHWLLRDVCMYGLAMLSPKKDAKLFDGYDKSAKGLFKKDCEEYGIFGDIDCATEGEKHFKTMQEAMAGYRETVATACAPQDLDCLAKNALSDKPRVRERAAYELGRWGDERVVSPLVQAIQRPMEKDEDVAPRFAAVLGLSWAARANPEARKAAKSHIGALTEQVNREKSKRLSQASAEDIHRLISSLEGSGD